MFSKELFAADVDRSKCSHATSSNAPVCAHYIDDRVLQFDHGDVSIRLKRKSFMLEFKYIFLFSFFRKQVWHFVQIVSSEMSKPVLWET